MGLIKLGTIALDGTKVKANVGPMHSKCWPMRDIATKSRLGQERAGISPVQHERVAPGARRVQARVHGAESAQDVCCTSGVRQANADQRTSDPKRHWPQASQWRLRGAGGRFATLPELLLRLQTSQSSLRELLPPSLLADGFTGLSEAARVGARRGRHALRRHRFDQARPRLAHVRPMAGASAFVAPIQRW